MIAALTCDGVTEIEDIYHIERGYEEIVEKIRGLGGDMKKIVMPDPAALRQAN